MFASDAISHRLRTGCQTMDYPGGPAPSLPDLHGGSLRLESAKCATGCSECLPVCPTKAITRNEGSPARLYLGLCLFCGACVEACPEKAITQTRDHRMAT